MTEVRTAPFVMHGARDAIASGLAHIEEQVTAFEQAVIENPGLAFDLAKTIVESVCRTVLSERKIAFGEGDDLPKLFRTASQNLPLLPPTASSESKVRASLKQTLGGLSTAIQGICELRNECGFASHGSGTARPPMEAVQALLAAEAADTIVGFLHRVHSQDRTRPNLVTSRESLYDRNPDFNESVDEVNGPITLFDLDFRPSEILFNMEPESYRVYLAEFEMGSDDEMGAANGSGKAGMGP